MNTRARDKPAISEFSSRHLQPLDQGPRPLEFDTLVSCRVNVALCSTNFEMITKWLSYLICQTILILRSTHLDEKSLILWYLDQHDASAIYLVWSEDVTEWTQTPTASNGALTQSLFLSVFFARWSERLGHMNDTEFKLYRCAAPHLLREKI